jgi:hypothetical protein
LRTGEYINAQKEDWLTVIYLPKRASYVNSNERKINQKIKLDVCTNRICTNIEEQKYADQNIYINKRRR